MAEFVIGVDDRKPKSYALEILFKDDFSGYNGEIDAGMDGDDPNPRYETFELDGLAKAVVDHLLNVCVNPPEEILTIPVNTSEVSKILGKAYKPIGKEDIEAFETALDSYITEFEKELNEHERISLKERRYELSRLRKEQIAGLKEENSGLREKIAKIRKIVR